MLDGAVSNHPYRMGQSTYIDHITNISTMVSAKFRGSPSKDDIDRLLSSLEQMMDTFVEQHNGNIANMRKQGYTPAEVRALQNNALDILHQADQVHFRARQSHLRLVFSRTYNYLKRNLPGYESENGLFASARSC